MASKVLHTLTIIMFIYSISWLSTFAMIALIQRFFLQSDLMPILEFWLVDNPFIFNSVGFV